jgi:Phospholipid methyltransferase
MTPWWAFPVAAALLSLERGCYVAVSRAPDAFQRGCARPWVAWIGGPVAVVGALFVGFKALQVAVFAWWCWVQGDGSGVVAGDAPVLTVAAVLILAGQILNASVFRRLGAAGVFYGNLFGYPLPWHRGFPFSVVAHPQYVGAVLSIWGFFVATRFPHGDWYWLPALETVYYAVSTCLEGRAPPTARADASRISGSGSPLRDRPTASHGSVVSAT